MLYERIWTSYDFATLHLPHKLLCLKRYYILSSKLTRTLTTADGALLMATFYPDNMSMISTIFDLAMPDWAAQGPPPVYTPLPSEGETTASEVSDGEQSDTLTVSALGPFFGCITPS